jgi:hypothetical protein
VQGKITYVHRRLWQALVRLLKQISAEGLGKIQKVRTSKGKHELQIVPYPRWVPAEVKVLARGMNKTGAIFATW